jgi:hypothetical protein
LATLPLPLFSDFTQIGAFFVGLKTNSSFCSRSNQPASLSKTKPEPVFFKFAGNFFLIHFQRNHFLVSAVLQNGLRQGDQIGRIFARWAAVIFGQFFLN